MTCDGKYDCPDGVDEQNCSTRICAFLFKCKWSSTCLHFTSLCDGVVEDDEICDLPSCPWKCSCLHYAIKDVTD